MRYIPAFKCLHTTIMDNHFQTFSVQHIITLLVLGIFTWLMIIFGRKAEGRKKMWYGYSIASASFAMLLIDLGLRLITHTLDILNDLPIFLCDLVALVLPFVILQENRKWLGIFYFWTLGGTLQALITPELSSGFPTFEFFRYFIMHGGIVSAMIYSVIVLRLKISWRDLVNAVIYIQVYLVFIHVINMSLGSNYSYTMAKPISTTLLNVLGDWPWYIFSAEVLMIIMFILLLVPFLIFRGKSEPEEV